MPQYTRFEYDVLVHPNEEVSLAYRFRPDALLEPREFGLIVSVYYHDEVSATIVCCSTNVASLVEISPLPFSTEPLILWTLTMVLISNSILCLCYSVSAQCSLNQIRAFIYLGLLAIVGLGGFFGYQTLGKKTKLVKRRPTTPYIEVGDLGKNARTVHLDSEWLEGTHAVSPSKARSSSAKREREERKKQK